MQEIPAWVLSFHTISFFNSGFLKLALILHPHFLSSLLFQPEPRPRSSEVLIMGKMRHLFLLLSVLGLQVAAQDETLTIDAVSSQIDDFLQLIQNGSLATGNTSSLITSGCTLAVSNRFSCKNLLAEVIQCSFINFALPGQVSYPASTAYEYQESRYWSTFQSTDTPTCRFVSDFYEQKSHSFICL
jgi:hypothetical protein